MKTKNFPQKKSLADAFCLRTTQTLARETARTCSFARVRTRNQVGARARERECVFSSSAFEKEREREREGENLELVGQSERC